jgi:hypothetical protein
VFICTFSGWIKAFPTWTEKAQDVARCLLKRIIPQFGIPVSTESDNGLAFVAEVVQLMAKGLGITKAAHSLPPPVFRESRNINRTLKLQLGKLCQETHLQWNQLLLISLFRIRSSRRISPLLKFFSDTHPFREP